MKLFEYKPVDYVDVHNEIPVEWMAGQLKEKQTAFDSQVDALNKTAENNLKLNTGAFGTKMYDELQKDLQSRLTSMTDNLMTRGDVAGTSGEFSKYIRDFSLDPRVKTLNKDYDLWKLHQEELLKHPGAIDMSQYGPQIGENGTTAEEAFRNYNIVLPENSVEELEQTVNKLKPNVSDDGKTFSFYDPVLKKVMKSTDKAQIEDLSAKRIKQLRDDYYTNWINNPKSMYHKIKLSGNKLDLFNTPEGKKKYDELTEYLQNYAYTEYRDLEDADPYNNNKPTKPGATPDGEAAVFIPQTSNPYGRENALGELYGKPGQYISDPSSMQESISNIDNEQRILLNTMYMLQNNPAKKAEYDVANAKWRQLEDKKIVDKSWQQSVEKELYNRVPAADYAKGVDAEKRWIDENSLQIADFGALSMLTGKTKAQIMQEILYGGVTSYSGVDYDEIEGFLKKAAEVRNVNFTGDAKALYDRYQKYNAYQTTGESYIVNGAKNKEAAIALFNNLISSGPVPKDIMTDKQSEDGKLAKAMEAYKTDAGYAFDKMSYEILADDMDGLVFVTHFLDKDNKSQGFEWKLEDTPNVRDLLGLMVPHESVILTQFSEATQSLKKSHRQATGDFNIQRFDGSTDNIDFNRRPVGDGQFEYYIKYKDKDGASQERAYPSINKMIIGESIPKARLDALYMKAYQELQTAISNRDTAAYNAAVDKLGQMDADKANSGKQQPQNQSQDLGW